MAKPTTARFGAFAVMLGSGTGTITYAAPCGFNSKSLQLTKDLNEIVIPDCNDPDAPAWVGRDVASLSASVNGEGVLAKEAVKAWLDAYNSNSPVPVKVVLTLGTSPAASVTWTGLMHIANLSIDAEIGNRVQLSVEMQSDGELTTVQTGLS